MLRENSKVESRTVGRDRLRVALISFSFGEYCIRLASAVAQHAEVLLMLPHSMAVPHLTNLDGGVDLFFFRDSRFRQPLKEFRILRTIFHRIRDFAPDLIHYQGGHLWFDLALPLLSRYPLVFTIHDLRAHLGDRHSQKYPFWIEKFARRRADELIVHAQQILEPVARQLNVPKEKVSLIPHIQIGNSLSSAADKGEEEHLVLFFGRIWEYKGLEYLIRAEPLISARVPDVRILIAGQGEDFSRYARMMTHPNRFIVHNEYISEERAAEYFRRASVVVLPYVEASQSGVILLAYSAGKPVVATSVGGLPEMVEHGRTGYLVEPRDTAQLAEAIVRLLLDRPLRRQMGVNGKRKIETEYSSDLVARGTIDVYRRAISRTAQVPERAQGRVSVARTARQDKPPAKTKEQVYLREFPYPYKATLAICSDIDDTQSTSEFVEVQKFLNTKQATSLGEGLGLEIGNSFYFYDDNHHFSYFTHDARAQGVIIDMIRAGYIDCLHTYGDAATSRQQILRALDVLYEANCMLQVWVNHNGARSNLSRKFEYDFYLSPCEGDSSGSQVFHADVTLDYGIRFAWVGAMTRLIGQSPQRSSSALTTVLDPNHPLTSGVTMAKEWVKDVLGSWGDERFTLHRRNQLTQVMELENGQKLHEFIRYCHDPKGFSFAGTAHGLAQNISPRVLERLKAVRGSMIVYTHLGQRNGCDQLIPPETRSALRGLEQEFRGGQVYVTTTSKLLNYNHALRYLIWSCEMVEGQTTIQIQHLEDPVFGKLLLTEKQLQGITFYVTDRNRAEVYIQGTRVARLQRNPADDSGMESVTIPFVPVDFPL